MDVFFRSLLRILVAMALAMAFTGCAYRFDSAGNKVYGLQFGQDFSRETDYSNPRMPILPKWRPSLELWPSPPPYEFNDLSRYSFLNDPAPASTAIASVGDNGACAACSDSTARLALLVSRADVRDSSRAPTAR